MKKILFGLVTIGITLPLVAGAQMMRPFFHSANSTPPAAAHTNLEMEQSENAPKKIPKKTLNKKSELAPFETKPKDFGSGLDKHAELIQLQLDRLESSQIPEDKRDMVREELLAELAWLAEMQAKLEAAETQEEQDALEAEAKEHITQIKEERRQRLAQAADLPTESPFNRAEAVGAHVQDVVEQLEQQGKDVVELQQALDEYLAAVSQGQELFAGVEGDKTYERLIAIRDQLKLVREKGQVMRNLLPSLLEPAPLDLSNS